jgi:acetamidase/formamidase
MGAPRIVTADRLMTVVSAPSVTDAARTAFRELKLWLEQDWQLTNDEAAMVMGMAAHCGIGQVTNLLHTAKCSIDRSLLPPDAGGLTMPWDPRQ